MIQLTAIQHMQAGGKTLESTGGKVCGGTGCSSLQGHRL
jgi:hypothetical protein